MGACFSFLAHLFSGDLFLSKEAREASSELTVADHQSISVRGKGADVVCEGLKISGQGSCIMSPILEQDAAFWEVHVIKEGTVSVGVSKSVPEGDLANLIGEGKFSFGTTWGALELNAGDVIGVCFQHSDFPMLRFYVNGEEVVDRSIDRVRGDVHPVVSVGDGAELNVVFGSGEFKHGPPSGRFQAVMVAQDML